MAVERFSSRLDSRSEKQRVIFSSKRKGGGQNPRPFVLHMHSRRSLHGSDGSKPWLTRLHIVEVHLGGENCANDAQKWNDPSVLYACNDGR